MEHLQRKNVPNRLKGAASKIQGSSFFLFIKTAIQYNI